MNITNGKLNKKSSKKSSSQIPINELGFRAKVFYDSTYEYVPRKRYNKYSKYEQQKRQQNFRSRLSCIIDPSHATHQEIGDMKFDKRYQWKKIKYIIFRTKQELSCCICLTKQFVAPQMTFCGHVFCWHCLLMHYEKSLKATSCPVCNQIFEIQQVKTCNTLFLPPISQGDKIKFRLKSRLFGQKTIFDTQTLQQDTSLSHVVRVKNSKSLQRFILEHDEILNEMKRNQDPETQRFLVKVLQKSQRKIDQFKKIIQEQKNTHLKIHKHETFVNGVLCKMLLPQEVSSQKIMTFYQQEEGRYAYLHPICEKYLLKNFQTQFLPLKIEDQILLKEQTQFSNQNVKKYKYLNHLPENQDFDFVFIKMDKLIDYKLFEEFQKEFQLYKKKKQQIIMREEQYAKHLNQKYEKQQQYIRKLKKMQQSQFHDIIVPTNMVDLAEIQDSNIFPSLVQKSSQNQSYLNSESEALSQVSLPVQFGKKNKNKKQNFTLKQQDFPGLKLALKTSLEQQEQNIFIVDQTTISRTLSEKPQQTEQTKIKREQQNFPQLSRNISLKQKGIKQQNETNGKRKGKKKNKEKFVDVTHQFFQRNQQDY